MNTNKRIFIVGNNNIFGKSLISRFRLMKFNQIFDETNNKIDLLKQSEVTKLFSEVRPEIVILTNCEAGGIGKNLSQPADLIYKNLEIQNNVIHSAYFSGVEKLLFIGSSCSYPRECSQPMKEEYFLSGKPEETSLSYAVAKIAGAQMCLAYNKQYQTSFFPIIPATIYGPMDDFDLQSGHVIPALIRKFHDAREKKLSEVVVWGSGNPRREFIFIDDIVDASIFLIDNSKEPELVNIGCGYDISIKELSNTIKKITSFKGKIVFDTTKPDGAYRKLLDSSKIFSLGWKPKINLEEGLKITYEWFKKNLIN